MRWRRLMWLLLSMMVAAVVLRSGQYGAGLNRSLLRQHTWQAQAALVPPVSTQTSLRGEPAPQRLRFRLSNTAKTQAELLRNDRAVLLENALLDTDEPLALPIPQEFRREGDPQSYIVQARAPWDQRLRDSLAGAGASVVAYIPNNCFLVRASASAAEIISANLQVQVVLPYEPYYKLKLSLLEAASSAAPTVPLALNALLFPDAPEAVVLSLRKCGAEIISQDSSPFGPVLKIRIARARLGSVAKLPQIQALELSSRRVTANDLCRATIGVAADTIVPLNYLGLTGTNVIVNVNDTGVDVTQPDLSGHILVDTPDSGTDTNGHGTHVAGIIGGSGHRSVTVTNAPGSTLPAVDSQFRGQAPGVTIFAIDAGLDSGLSHPDSYLQQAAAATNAFISNNSWHYSEDNEYDLAAASYDAAVRDALPAVPGAQPLLFVFAAGNNGQGRSDGTGGVADTIQSPATGKNVITVGALEQLRFITNQTWTCSGLGGPSSCSTNSPWLPLTDSSNQVAAFSSRGNVGVGIEGDAGRLKPDVVAPGTFVFSTRSTQWNQKDYYAQTADFLVKTPDTNYFAVLSNLNDTAGPYYRFESGTSLAAAAASGALALMQEFFARHLGQTNSPALMKALLINGARFLRDVNSAFPGGLTNAQGWGLLQLPNSLPGSLSNLDSAAKSMLFFDQGPQNCLATGQSHTRIISVSPAATNLPLRMTLVWTDPPGDPVAGVKLVNDLDLIVTNLDTGQVFWGNDIPAGHDFSRPWDQTRLPNTDCINNVENVYLGPSVASRYSVTVLGRHVNVNALTSRTNAVVQDYALVISSGNGEVGNALTTANASIVSKPWASVFSLTNTFTDTSGDIGAILLKERIGAGSPLLGTDTVALQGNTNTLLSLGTVSQWHFYICTNDTGFTNAAFLTFLAPTLATPAELANLAPTNHVHRDADIDFYVSRDPGLTNLDPQVLSAADASVARGGDEMLVYSNATPGIYYVGIKCESREGAEYGFLAIFSQQPFFEEDGLGNDLLRGFPASAPIPSGNAGLPGKTYLFCVNPDGNLVRRVIATNILSHPSMSDLQMILQHNSAFATLNNHSTTGSVQDRQFIYDDSLEGDIPGAQRTDGPGSLLALSGQSGAGQWLLTIASTNQAGTDQNFGMFVENQPDLTAGMALNLLPGACRQDFLYVPPGVTNLTASVGLVAGGAVSWQLYPDYSSLNCPTLELSAAPASASIIIDATSRPPINPGLYVSRLCNSGQVPASLNLLASLGFAPNPPSLVRVSSLLPTPIADDAISSSIIEVTNTQRVVSAEVGIRLAHPRISDLAISLISPNGNRVLLQENRGGFSADGMGLNQIATNAMPVSSTGGPQAATNRLDTGQSSGTVAINFDFFSLPDDMRIYYEGQLLYDSGLVSFTGATNISYGPGTSTIVTIVMNEGGNFDTNTAWFYTVTSTHPVPLYFTFTENTNLSTVPVKFAPVPFTNLNYTAMGVSSNAIYYQPEESLARVAGQPALGRWTLELRDCLAGPSSLPPQLLSWQLSFLLADAVPQPIALFQNQPATNLLGPGQVQWFSVDPPSWLSFVTNSLRSATLPVNVLFNQNMPPTGTNAGDVILLSGTRGGSFTFQTNGLPPLIPGLRYYLGVQNTNASTVEFVLEVMFDVQNVVTLQNGVAYAALNPGPVNAIDYYRYVVTSNAVRAQLEINAPGTNMALLVRKGHLPFLANYDYVSDNPGTNDELIVLYPYSKPVSLSPGEWFLAAVNRSSGPASYSIIATEFPVYGTNLTVLNPVADSTSFCLSWNSLLGVHYYIQAKQRLEEPQWVTLSPTLTAVDSLSTYCIALPSLFHFFRVSEGLVVAPPQTVLSGINPSPNGLLLQWGSDPGDVFNVQWAASLPTSTWNAFTNSVSSTNGLFFFLDDGAQTDGFGSSRFYRLERVP